MSSILNFFDQPHKPDVQRRKAQMSAAHTHLQNALEVLERTLQSIDEVPSGQTGLVDDHIQAMIPDPAVRKV